MEVSAKNSLQSLEWFPMRVTYRRELKMKDVLDELGIENFVPMHYELIDTANGPRRMLVPAIHNLIFVRSTQETLTELKMHRREFEPLRYMMKPLDGGYTIMRVPDREMENFLRVARVEDERVMFLDYNDFISKIGRRVRINEGHFAGVEGVIKRIKKNKHVVVQIEGVAAVAITFVPASFLSLMDDN